MGGAKAGFARSAEVGDTWSRTPNRDVTEQPRLAPDQFTY